LKDTEQDGHKQVPVECEESGVNPRPKTPPPPPPPPPPAPVFQKKDPKEH